ncbi:hypothetical protein V6N13_016884 [Hibiscus sabdariffa]|uniref:Uncharacterized protein n=1 Tax=Hibiscus sabdariffa TaxID=183260 RepID=A0ABR2PUD4_9ROSI
MMFIRVVSPLEVPVCIKIVANGKDYLIKVSLESSSNLKVPLNHNSESERFADIWQEVNVGSDVSVGEWISGDSSSDESDDLGNNCHWEDLLAWVVVVPMRMLGCPRVRRVVFPAQPENVSGRKVVDSGSDPEALGVGLVKVTNNLPVFTHLTSDLGFDQLLGLISLQS